MAELVNALPDDPAIPDDPDVAPPEEGDGSLFDPETPPEEPYDDYQCKYTYVSDEGKIQSPVASDDTRAACVVTQVHAPAWQKVVTWTAARKGSWPLVPAVEDDDDNLELLGKTIEPHAPTLLGNGRAHLFRISGSYTYAMLRPFDPEEDLPVGSAPDDLTASEDLAVPTADVFDPDLNG